MSSRITSVFRFSGSDGRCSRTCSNDLRNPFSPCKRLSLCASNPANRSTKSTDPESRCFWRLIFCHVRKLLKNEYHPSQCEHTALDASAFNLPRSSETDKMATLVLFLRSNSKCSCRWMERIKFDEGENQVKVVHR